MDFWFFLLTYGGMGTLVGLVRARYDFKVAIADPEENREYKKYTGKQDPKGREIYYMETRTESERIEACAAEAARWGWLSAIFWPFVLVALIIIGVTAAGKNIAGGKELRDIRAAKAQAEVEAKAAQYAAEAREAWKKLYGPDAPEDIK